MTKAKTAKLAQRRGPTEMVSCRIPVDVLDLLDKTAGVFGTTRSDMLKAILQHHLAGNRRFSLAKTLRAPSERLFRDG